MGNCRSVQCTEAGIQGLNECEVGTGLIACIVSEAHEDDYCL